MGIGLDNVYLINTDSAGKMNMDHLGEFFVTYQFQTYLKI